MTDGLPERRTGNCRGIVREWDDEQGFGVIDSDQTAGGCWAHFSALDMEGYRALIPGHAVELDWETARQDGFSFRATRVVPL